MDSEHPRNLEEKMYIPNYLGKRLNLWITAVAVNIISFTAGIAFGWMSPMLDVLQAADSPVGPISDADASWLASVISLSRMFTIPLYMYANDRFGRKKTGYMVAAAFVTSNAMALFARSFAVLFCSRVIAGLAVGGTAILVPAYISDIAEDANKGILGGLFGLFMNAGITFSYVVGCYTSYTVFHICSLAISAAFVFALYWLPESPLFLLITGRPKAAREALFWLRNGSESETEFDTIEHRAEEVMEKMNSKVSLSAMLDRPTIRALLIGVGLMANQQFSGISPIMSYTVTIFKEAGSTISPNISTILVGCVTMAGSVMASLTIERCGRRILLIASDVVLAISLGVLGTYFYFSHLGWNVKSCGWLPLTCLSTYMFTYGMGFSSIPFTVVTEMVNSHARGLVQTIILMFLSISMYLLVFCYTSLSGAIGQYGCFWSFSATCVIATFCIFFGMPETKNRSLEDVISQMNSDKYVKSVLSWGKGLKENEESKV